MAEKLKRTLGLRDVFLFYIVSGLSLRWIATAAAASQSAITVWVLAFFGFFLPLAGHCARAFVALSPRRRPLHLDPEAFLIFRLYGSLDLLDEQPALLWSGALFCRQQFALPHSSRQPPRRCKYLFPAIHHRHAGAITVLNVIGLGVGKWLYNLGPIGMALP